MPIYTIHARTRGGGNEIVCVDLKDDEAAIAGARNALSQEATSVAVARGRGADLNYLGVWDRSERGRVSWRPKA